MSLENEVRQLRNEVINLKNAGNPSAPDPTVGSIILHTPIMFFFHFLVIAFAVPIGSAVLLLLLNLIMPDVANSIAEALLSYELMFYHFFRAAIGLALVWTIVDAIKDIRALKRKP
jgi:hypothetical protein